MKPNVSSGWTVLFLLTIAATNLSWPALSPAAGLPESGSPRSHPSLSLPLADIKTAVSGGEFSCVVTNGGAVRCWGDNTYGQLGDGTTTDRSLPVPVTGLDSGVTAIAAGKNHACAVTAAGGVRCWGENNGGQLGDGTTTDRTTPVNVVGLSSGVRNITAGFGISCALKTDGSVHCWGGRGVLDLAGPVTALEAGRNHVCAVLANGAVQCWGWNVYGQLGDNTTTDSNSPVTVLGLNGPAGSLGAGFAHTCAALQSGGLQCWGWNSQGQLGDGTKVDRHTPALVTGLAGGTASVSGGDLHSCALVSGGGLQCWGVNGSGQLGDGTTTGSVIPVQVIGLGAEVKALSAGESHNVAVTANGSVKAWGHNWRGQLGNGATIWANLPLDVAGLPVDTLTTATGYSHTCALLASGAVRCWGANGSGQLGDGNDKGSHLPVAVSGLDSGVTHLAAGWSHNCVITPGGGVQCWGRNLEGQLGDGSKTLRRTPVTVQGLNGTVLAVAAGYSHTCALMAGGDVYCWGRNDRGQLGTGSFLDSTSPVKVIGLPGSVASIAVGDDHTCALLTGGGVQCWGGGGLGGLGNGSNDNSAVPVPASGLSGGVVSLSGKALHTCAVTTGGAVKCWGYNFYGQLGNGTTLTNSNIPVEVVGLSSGIQTVVAGVKHTCARTILGALKCWGENQEGNLGDGTNDRHNTPVDVSGLAAGVSSLDLGGGHACAVLSTKRLKCWGWNGNGQLGLGTLDKSLTPIDVLASVDPLLTSNYVKGQPGSFFTLTGQHFPPGSLATVTVNGTVLTSSLAINETGGFILFIDTAGADPGTYQVNVTVNGSASSARWSLPGKYLSATNAVASLTLDPQAPLNLMEGGGLVLSVPGGIGGFNSYLPLILKN